MSPVPRKDLSTLEAVFTKWDVVGMLVLGRALQGDTLCQWNQLSFTPPGTTELSC